MKLTLEVRKGLASEDRLVPAPDADTARAALRSLDGAQISQLVADDEQGHVLLIGGGNEGRFVVNYLVNDDEHGFHVVNPDGTPEDVAVVTGGQLGSFRSDMVVGGRLAVDALVHFIATGQRCGTLTWEQEF